MKFRSHPCLIAAMAVALCALSGCSRGGKAGVEAWEDGAYRPIAHQSYQIDGKRDGSTTRAVATFILEDGVRLAIELDVIYDPTPALGEGTWRVDGPHAGSGTVRAQSVKFLGGQGEGPSLGGRFLLEADGVPRFRVVLPARPVEQTRWDGQ